MADPYLEVEEPSDDEDEEAVSSEDELDILLHGTTERKRRLLREYLTGESEASEDEFEKDMAAELDSTFRAMEGTWAPADGASSSTGAAQARGQPEPRYYDDIYFDSDSEDEDGQEGSGPASKKKCKKRRVLTNDELLYDPEQDEKDQAWVDMQRRSYRGLSRRPSKEQPTVTSDAVLNCPSCMTTLCLDCQRHELYPGQYRAMFVMNCIINRGEVLKYKEAANKKRRNWRKKAKGPMGEVSVPPQGNENEEAYHPVRCAECSVEVAVFDKDEVYHFFNILASHC